LNFSAGVRYDATAFLNSAEFNPLVFDELGIRTDQNQQISIIFNQGFR
jgi:hypothetical protein